MEKVEVTKCQNGYLVQLENATHVCSGFESHAALGKVIAEALGVVTAKKERKRRKRLPAMNTPELTADAAE